MDDLPILYAARYPGSEQWIIDQDEAFARGIATARGAEVVIVDVPGLLRVVRAAQNIVSGPMRAVDMFNLQNALAALTKEPTP